MKIKLITLLLVLCSLSAAAQKKSSTPQKEEMRAVWLTTNYRIDWPSKAYKNSNDINIQQEELIDMLDKLKAANVNMVFLQVRFQGTVIYNSQIEPISHYIAGVKNTWSKYDPLKFAVSECHKRGIECHAWFVAYNAGAKENMTETIYKNRNLLKSGEREYWFDPGLPETNAYLISLIKELVKNYDIDGFHLDYIRYPAEGSDFGDEDTYRKYRKGGIRKDDWRRENINRFVSDVYDTIKIVKPWVQVSSAVVPYYKKLSANRKHWTAYHDAYQDPEEWLKNGKMDFIVPMIYNKSDLFDSAVKDWMSRSQGRYVVPGIGVYLLNEKEKGGNWSLKDISDQIQFCQDNHTHGTGLFSAKHLMTNKKGLYNELQNKHYNTPALLPPMSWLSKVKPPAPGRPKAAKTGQYIYLNWDDIEAPDNNKYFYNVYRSATSPVDTNNPANLVDTRINGSSLFIDASARGYYYVVTTYDRYHNESMPSAEIYFKP